MSNIGYAIFKKTDTFVMDSNGMLEQLKLADNVFVNNIPKLEVGEKRICFQRIASNRLKSSIKDAILVTSVARLHKNNSEAIIGSAIIFKAFQVNEQKIIDGVAYLLNQLKRNFEGEYNLSDTNLGVILPSVNGNFNIFKEKYLQQITSKQNVKCVDTLSLEKGEVARTLHHFYTHPALNHITHLLVVSNHTPAVAFMQNGYEKVSIQQLITPPNNQPQKIALTTSYQKENTALKTKLTNTEAEKENALTNKKKYGLFAIISLIAAIIFGILYFTKKSTIEYVIDLESIKGSTYPIGDAYYIDNKNINLNVRSEPDFKKKNIIASISDGDEVYVIGLDKKTLWAYITFNNSKEKGYINSDFLASDINRERLEPINSKGNLYSNYNGIAYLLSTPKKNSEQHLDIYNSTIILQNSDKITVKNKLVNSDWYSVSVIKHNKTYNGYLEGKYLNIQN